MKDELGDRMKSFYEDRTRYFLPRRTYTIIRLDGKAFHTYTKGLKKPFDDGLIEDMNETAKFLCKEIQGCKFAYVQSDEISLLLTDFDKIGTSAWYDGNIQKIASVSASLATGKFNRLRDIRFLCEKEDLFKGCLYPFSIAFFDSRAFTIPSRVEVENYFIWRQQDATRNSISLTAQSLYSSKELHGKNTSEMQEMCFKKGVNWNDLNDGYKRGRIIYKENYEKEPEVIRSRYICEAPPIFTQEREIFEKLIENKNEIQ